MKIYRIMLKRGNPFFVRAYVNPYEEGNISLVFADPTKATVFSLQLKKEKNIEAHCVLNVLMIQDAVHFSIIKEFLIEKDLIEMSERGLLASIEREIQEILRTRQNLSPSLRPGQMETLIDGVAKVYIDDIVNSVSDYRLAVTLLAIAFSSQGYNSMISEAVVKHLDEANVDHAILGSVDGLFKVCHGMANMESTFIRISSALPTLTAQRIKVINVCVDELLNKFTNLSDKEKLFMILGLLLFRDEEQRLMPTTWYEVVVATLTDSPEKTAYAFGKVGIDQLVNQTIYKVFKTICNTPEFITKMIALANELDSIVLRRFLETKKQVTERNLKQQEDALMIALNENNIAMVREALKVEKDINRYLDGFRTPLMIAAYQCSDEIVEEILKLNPDLAKFNQVSVSNVLGLVINMNPPSSSKVKILLSAGADPASICMHVSPQPVYIKERQWFGVNAFKLAIDKFCDNPPLRAEYNEIICNLFYFILGRHINSLKWPIFSLADFMARVDEKDYHKCVDAVIKYIGMLPKECIAYSEMQFLRAHIERRMLSVGSMVRTNIYLWSGHPHDQLMTRIERALGNKSAQYAVITQSLEQHQYSQALRRICTVKDHHLAYELASILLSFDGKLWIDINQKAGKDMQSALDYAKKSGNDDLYALFVSHGSLMIKC